MTLPPFLLGAALLLWGWQTGLPAVAVVLAVLLEGSRLTAWRWDLTRDDFQRVATGCALLFIGLCVYLAVTSDASGSGVSAATQALRQWVPFVVLPLVVAQVYSTSETIDVGALRVFVGKKIRSVVAPSSFRFNLTAPFFAICLFSAGFTDARTPWFYPAVCGLIVWALWSIRPKTSTVALWGGLLVSAAALGYVGHTGLHALRGLVEDRVTQWMVNVAGSGGNPFQAQTAIGSIGELKQSDRIVLRIEAAAPVPTPLLVRQASYNQYQSSVMSATPPARVSVWLARDSAFSDVPPQVDGTTWRLQSEPAARQRVTVAASLSNGKGLLALPNGAAQVEDLPVGKMQRNRLGAVQVEEGPGLVRYRVLSAPDGSHEAPPTAADRTVLPNEAPLISKIAAELRLAAMPPQQALRAVQEYFQGRFRYSTFQGERQPGATPMEDFFLRTKAGHCEYFATATVLLLRAAGIPARYATGYSVQEFSRLENLYVVRDRHAHAWVLAYVDGAWHDVDTTPATWYGVESEQTAWWQPAADLWSWAAYQVLKWRWGERSSDLATTLLWISIPLGLFAVWRFVRAKQGGRVKAERVPAAALRAWPGQDSEWYALERQLQAKGWARHPWEPWSDWLRRVGDGQGVPAAGALRHLLALHYRYRFDPRGLSDRERQALKSEVTSWSAQQEQTRK